MLFKRRKKLNPLEHIKTVFKSWKDWKRSFLYIKHRILRLPQSTHKVAMGLASGCVVSWTPVFGFHIVQSYLFCKIFKASFLAGLVGTLFGNPWTFPFLLWTSYQVGHFILMVLGYDDFFVYETDQATFNNFVQSLGDIISSGLGYMGNTVLNIFHVKDFFTVNLDERTFPNLWEYIVLIFTPTLIGGYVMAIVTFPMFYYGFYYFIKGARQAKIKVGHKVHDIVDRHKENKSE